ncbi:DNA-3-methyladenine glycosylase 2 family protein [Colwelliaceae bacterium BS250]
MQLDSTVCMQARFSRDTRFDGQFYTAVLTTGIYCRPTCPAGPAKEENVRYYKSAAQAEFNGYQPCKRCKPELSPGQKLPTIIDTALAILNAQPHVDVQQLSKQCNIGDRQLQRLFQQSLGLTPKQFINQKRQISARKLLLTTTLPLADIAIISGFGSLRSFNDHVKAQYKLPPSKIRANSKAIKSDTLRITLHYKGDLNWPLMLSFFQHRQIPSIEHVADTYQRTIHLDNCFGWLQVSKPEADCLYLDVQLSDYSKLPEIVTRVRKMFDLDCHLDVVREHLKQDPILTASIDRFEGLRLPGCWDVFEFSIRAILGQQISVKAATTLAGRIAEKFGQQVEHIQGIVYPEHLPRVFPSYQKLLNCDFDGLGITNTRQQTLHTWIEFYSQNIELFNRPGDTESFEQELCKLKGIGPWTANYLAMRGLGLPDAFPAADLGIIKALSSDAETINSKQILKISEAWRPWRAYAAIYLWHSLKPNT